MCIRRWDPKWSGHAGSRDASETLDADKRRVCTIASSDAVLQQVDQPKSARGTNERTRKKTNDERTNEGTNNGGDVASRSAVRPPATSGKPGRRQAKTQRKTFEDRTKNWENRSQNRRKIDEKRQKIDEKLPRSVCLGPSTTQHMRPVSSPCSTYP